jgi:hypothetical protein
MLLFLLLQRAHLRLLQTHLLLLPVPHKQAHKHLLLLQAQAQLLPKLLLHPLFKYLLLMLRVT